MRAILFITFIGLGIGVLAYWNYTIEKDNERKEAQLLAEIAKDDLKESFERVVKANTFIENGEKERKSTLKVEAYKWDLAAGIPASESAKIVTTDLLNVLKSIDEQKSHVNIAKRKELRAALELFNQNPAQAEEIFNYLLNSPEIEISDGMQVKLLQVASYASFDKKSLIELSEKIMMSTSIDPNASSINDLESKDQILKIKEASELIISQISPYKEEALAYVQNAMTEHQHPLIKEELLLQLGVYYPEEAQRLRKKEEDEGHETFDQYLKREQSK